MTPPGVMKWGESFEPVTPALLKNIFLINPLFRKAPELMPIMKRRAALTRVGRDSRMEILPAVKAALNVKGAV